MFNFEEDQYYQYDPCQIISNIRKKLKRGSYEHKGTPEMKELSNKLIFSRKEGEYSDLEQIEPEYTTMKITILIRVEDAGKIPRNEDIKEIDADDRKGNEFKVSSEPFLQIVEYPSSNIIVTKGKSVEEYKSIVDHYNYLNFQAKKDRENKEDKLRILQPPQLISALDKRNQ